LFDGWRSSLQTHRDGEVVAWLGRIGAVGAVHVREHLRPGENEKHAPTDGSFCFMVAFIMRMAKRTSLPAWLVGAMAVLLCLSTIVGVQEAAGASGEAAGGSLQAPAQGAGTAPAPSGWSLSLASNPLLIEAAPTESEQLSSTESARLASPEAVQAREESQTAYSGMGSGESEQLAGQAFPGLVQQPDGGLPVLAQGQRLVGFPSDFSATVELSEGRHAVIASSGPVAVESSSGRVPIDLSPGQAGSGFEARTPSAGMRVRLGGRLGEGASLAAVGVSLTPVSEGGVPLEAGGVVDSQAVFYGDSEDPSAGVRDVDTVMKIGVGQFSEETILRSQLSPSRLFFRVGLPQGASLVQEGKGVVNIMDAGRPLATIMVPGAHDSEGTAVQGVSMSLSGDVLVVSVPHQPGEYRMPLEVDPTVSEGQSLGRYQLGHNWWFYANSPGNVFTNYEPKYGLYGMEDHDPYNGSYKREEFGLFGYETQGESRIYEFTSESYDNNPSTISSTVYVGGPGGLESAVHNAEWTPTTVCVAEGCQASIGGSSNWSNGAFYKQAAVAEGSGAFEDLLRSESVYIVQEKAPTASSGSCGAAWVNVNACSVELSASDPGVGLNEYTLSSPRSAEWGTVVKACTAGLPCAQHATASVKLTGLPEGEDTIKATAHDPVGLSASSERVVKIDNLPPHGITLSGLPASKEIGAGEYKLKAEAADGEGATGSSGIRSIALSIDGREVGRPSGSCSAGPCTAQGEWTISGREYATGRHTIAVLATDNAGNSSSEQFTLTVRSASPVALGPGAVNPQSGEFALQATDVSVGGLSVSRSYRSRHLMAGAEGALSAQWGFALGGEETLVKQPNGNMVLTDSSGAQTSFASDGKGGFVSPSGDSNLTLSSTPCKAGETEYMLRDSASAARTCFKAPPGGSGEVLVPSIAEGATATDTVTYAYQISKGAEYAVGEHSRPQQITSGPDGDLWFTDYEASKIGRATTSGAITEYALPVGSGPAGIASGPDGDLWFTDQSTSRIGKITTSGVVSEYPLPAESYPERIVKGADGNLWFTEWHRNKIGKITTSGVITEYSVPSGSWPTGVASGPDGNLWFTDMGSSKVGKITTSGSVTEYSLPRESLPSGITSGPDGNVWFTESRPSRIAKITTAGTVTEYKITEGGAREIAVGPDHDLWFTNGERLGKMTTSGILTEYVVHSGSWTNGITAGPDGNIWYTEEYHNEIGMMPTLGLIVEPTKALAPVPAGVSCSPELKPGCRALTFNYASSTTATGEGPSEWGDVQGHLTRVYYTAYDPASKAMKTVEVAHYLYDKQARLRTEWDPRISPALKMTYGYDSEGHVTALTAPGEESWAITYGTTAGDGGGGRVLKVTRAAASAPLWAGEAPVSNAAPAITGSAVVGVRMATSNGSWSGSPVAYAYQWEDCNASGGECSAIGGATNANYTPGSGDVGHALVAQVSATNGGGSVMAASAPSALVTSSGPMENGEAHSPQPGSAVEYGVALSGTGLPNMTSGEVEKWGQKDLPSEATAIFPPDEPQGWPASGYGRATIYYRDAANRPVNVESPGGGISTSEYDEHNDVIRSLGPDNRAAALKEAKPAEAAKLLDTQSEYNSEGTELLSTLGPRHAIKLGSGKEVQARSHTLYSYDEGAPAEGGPYRLVTKVTQGAQVEGEGEQDVRSTVTSYSGQSGLGWKLRKPTSFTTDPNGLKLVHTTIYDEATGNVIETRAPGGASPVSFALSAKTFWTVTSKEWFYPTGVAIDPKGNIWVVEPGHTELQEFSSTGQSLAKVGSWGTGNGQFKKPQAVAIDKEGNLWVTDMGNNRVQELSSTGAFIKAFGAMGTGNGQLKEPQGIAIDPSGHVWVGDAGNNRVQEFSSTGEYVRQLGTEGSGNGQFKTYAFEPLGMWVATDSEGHVWVSDPGNYRVQELSSEGSYIAQLGSKGKGNGQFESPQGVTIDSKGDVWVTDSPDSRVEEFSHEGSYLSQFGSAGNNGGQLKSPKGLVFDAGGHAWVADPGNHRVQQLTESGGYVSQLTAEGPVEERTPVDVSVATDAKGNIWVADSANDRIDRFGANGEFVAQFGSEGTGNGQFKSPGWVAVDGKDDVWVTDEGNNRVQEFNEKGEYITQFGSVGSGNGQFAKPRGVAVDAKGDIWVVDSGNARVQEFNEKDEYISQFGSAGTGNGHFSEPLGITVGWGSIWVVDTGHDRVERFNEKGEYMSQFGKAGTGNGQLELPLGIAIDPKGTLWVADALNGRVQLFTENGSYLTQFSPKGEGPSGVAANQTGEVWISTSKLEKWIVKSQAATKTVYYGAAANPSYPSCGERPEWANLPCQTQPGEQPNMPGLPGLPVTTIAYNMYGEPASAVSTVTECVKTSPGTGKYTSATCLTSGSGEYETKTSTRSRTVTYDEAGRVESSEASSTAGTALPAVKSKYSVTTGALIEQSTSSESIKSAFNTIGQITSYTDATGNVSTYEYEPERDARLEKINDGKGTQTYVYDETTGAVKELIDSAAGTFTMGYDTEGNLTSEQYPNGMTATYTLDPAGERVGVVYEKERHCAGTCPETWYSDSVTPSIHGQWLSQRTSLASDSYTYDAAGRLTQAQSTPGSAGCTTRMYAYDEETNRLSLITHPPGAGGVCSSEGGTVENHSYDSANRLIDPGVAYEPFGEMSRLPAADAGGSELQSSFYADSQLASQTQAGQTVGYNLDPTGRPREIVSTGKILASEAQHYAGPSSTPAWTSEISGNWTRNITSLGGLVAIQHNGEAPVLQLTNLHGDIVATALDTEMATALSSKIGESSEYGVPATEAPPKYSWLGAHQLPTELPSGVIQMGARSYIPQLGRYLQTDPQPGGSANAYAYVFGDPINTTDLTGENASGPSAWAISLAAELTSGEAAAYETAVREEAQRKAAEAAAQAGNTITPGSPESGSAEEEWTEEESEESPEYGTEYAAFGPGPGAGAGSHVAHLVEAVLYQPLGEEASGQVSPAVSNLATLCHRELQSAGVGKPRGVCARLIDLCHSKFGGCGRLVKEGKPVRSSRRATSFCARLHDCPFPEPSNWAPVKYAVRKIVQAGKVIIEIFVLE
jgi:RHS repeat-associated protein